MPRRLEYPTLLLYNSQPQGAGYMCGRGNTNHQFIQAETKPRFFRRLSTRNARVWSSNEPGQPMGYWYYGKVHPIKDAPHRRSHTTSIGHFSRYLINSKPNEQLAVHNNYCSHYPIDSEVGEEALTVISLFNLAGQRNSRADNARVRDAIRLIKSLPTIRRTRVTNPTRKLTPSQYEQLLEIIQDNEEFSDKLRFEYTHSTQKFEIRMTTALHEGIVGEFTERFGVWKAELRKSNDSRVSDAAETIRPHGNKHIKPLALTGARDAKSPDGGIKHNCSLECRNPALVFEVEFSNNRKKELRDKAEAYTRSNGEIRTVIAVYMGEMHTAERKNERRLRKMYRTGQVNESGSYSYSTDEKNVTGEASILVWRATAQKNNTIAIERVQEKKFRDTAGKVIRSVLLRIPLEDCVCKGVIDSVKRSGAPPLEISSEALCSAIDMDLRDYRNERADVIREEVQREKEKKRNEEGQEDRKEEERLRRTTENNLKKNLLLWRHEDLLAHYGLVIIDDSAKSDGLKLHDIQEHFQIWAVEELTCKWTEPRRKLYADLAHSEDQKAAEDEDTIRQPEQDHVAGTRHNYCLMGNWVIHLGSGEVALKANEDEDIGWVFIFIMDPSTGTTRCVMGTTGIWATRGLL
ncbi:hypothetical protein NUW58_g1860 [Xylaria curta]|uniref:Uncharacterized protein n=1 Tax=Xylaria curta TaxID=42375 RepID=A0ACC1PJN3_9PEZI|nr:hypothetical protein NUW58_g1860 [Xylaria curta]